MDPCWKNLPIELVEKICNFLPKVRKINTLLSEEIRFQPNKFDRWYFNAASLFGFNHAYSIMYDDLRYVMQVPDVFPEEMPIEEVVVNMWRKMSPEQRDIFLII